MLPQQHFVLGYDTFVRLLDLKYYENSPEKLLSILKQLDEIGTKFAIGGRLNAKTQLFEMLDIEGLEIVPAEYKGMFSAVEDFRVDLSSTELRAKSLVV